MKPIAVMPETQRPNISFAHGPHEITDQKYRFFHKGRDSVFFSFSFFFSFLNELEKWTQTISIKKTLINLNHLLLKHVFLLSDGKQGYHAANSQLSYKSKISPVAEGNSSRAGIPSAAGARTGALYLPSLLLIRDVYCVLCPYGFFLHKYIRLLSSSELGYPREKAWSQNLLRMCVALKVFWGWFDFL